MNLCHRRKSMMSKNGCITCSAIAKCSFLASNRLEAAFKTGSCCSSADWVPFISLPLPANNSLDGKMRTNWNLKGEKCGVVGAALLSHLSLSLSPFHLLRLRIYWVRTTQREGRSVGIYEAAAAAGSKRTASPSANMWHLLEVPVGRLFGFNKVLRRGGAIASSSISRAKKRKKEEGREKMKKWIFWSKFFQR